MALFSDRHNDRAENGKDPRRGSSSYGSASAADIAREGVKTRRPGSRGRDEWDGGDTVGAPGSEEAGDSPFGSVDAAAQGPVEGDRLDRRGRRGSGGGRVTAPGEDDAAGLGVDTTYERPASLALGDELSIDETDKLALEESHTLRRKVVISVVILAVLAFVSLGIIGAQQIYGGDAYKVHSPLETIQMIGWHIQSLFSGLPYDQETMLSDYPFYYTMADKAGVVVITLLCAVLLALSGMLYQNVFRNPIAGPGMLGVSNGVNLGNTLLVYIFGIDAIGKVGERYFLCYFFGAAVLVAVVLLGRMLSGKNHPLDVVTMMLVGAFLSQLIGFIVNYLTLFVMDTYEYESFLEISQMLVVDTSYLSWICLGVACVVSIYPIWRLRFRLNILAYSEEEARSLGIDFTVMRAVALVCGGIMILAAQIHIGEVAMVSLIVPFLARSWFGCEFRKQLIGSICIGTIFMLVCRDIIDLIPFVGDGLGIGSAVSIMALPVFLFIMARNMRGWE